MPLSDRFGQRPRRAGERSETRRRRRIASALRRDSDLDLAIDAGRPLTLSETASLADAFDECDLPFKVDLLDWRTVSDHFRRIIAADRIPLD